MLAQLFHDNQIKNKKNSRIFFCSLQMRQQLCVSFLFQYIAPSKDNVHQNKTNKQKEKERKKENPKTTTTKQHPTPHKTK